MPVKSLTQRQALRMYSDKCYFYKQNEDYICMSPWKYSDPNGPKTSAVKHTYKGALEITARDKAQVALFQIYETNEYSYDSYVDAKHAIEEQFWMHGGQSSRLLLSYACKFLKKEG